MAWENHFDYEIAQAQQNKADFALGLDPAVAQERQIARLRTQLVSMGIDGMALDALLEKARLTPVKVELPDENEEEEQAE